MLLQVARVPRKKKEKRGGFNSRPLISCVYNEKEVRKKEEAKDGGKHREVEKLKRLYYIQRGGRGGGGTKKKRIVGFWISNLGSSLTFWKICWISVHVKKRGGGMVKRGGMGMNYVVKARRNLAAFARSKSSLAQEGGQPLGRRFPFSTWRLRSRALHGLHQPSLPHSFLLFKPPLHFFLSFSCSWTLNIHPFFSIPRVQRLRTCPPPHVWPFFLFPLRIQPLSLEARQRDKLLPRNIQIYFYDKVFIVFRTLSIYRNVLIFFFSFFLFYYLSFFYHFLAGFCTNIVIRERILSTRESSGFTRVRN